MLKFLGIGSCFNPLRGYTSAFYLDENEKHLYLFDVGGNIYERIIRHKLLEDVNYVTIIITHGHSDHMGSLPEIIFHLNIINNMIPDIVYPDKRYIKDRLISDAVQHGCYNLLTPSECKYFKIKEYKQKHNNLIDAYGYLFELNDKLVYFSGDTHTIQDEVVKLLKAGKLDYMYHEVTKYHNFAHTHIDELKKAIPKKYRDKVTCMHFDDEVMVIAQKVGFNIPKIY